MTIFPRTNRLTRDESVSENNTLVTSTSDICVPRNDLHHNSSITPAPNSLYRHVDAATSSSSFSLHHPRPVSRLRTKLSIIAKFKQQQQQNTSSSLPSSPTKSYYETALLSRSSSEASSSQLQDAEKRRKEKLARVIQELIDTEHSYFHDLKLTRQVFEQKPEHNPLTPCECKRIFGPLGPVIALEHDWVPLVSTCKTVDALARAFLSMTTSMETVYSEYCKRYEEALSILRHAQESRLAVAEYLEQCNREIQGRTTSWDLPSLLIKPVQRVLKYPLLLQEMLSLMSPGDAGSLELDTAARAVQLVADRINEMKRRKDIVEMIMSEQHKADTSSSPSSNNQRQGLNKTIARRRRKQPNNNKLNHDAFFEKLHQQFEAQQAVAHQLARDAVDWIERVKEYGRQLNMFAESLEDFYGPWEPITSFRKAVFVSAEEMENKVNLLISNDIPAYLQLFERPGQVIAQRTKLLAELDRRWEEYEAIHAQLVEELPRFLSLVADYFSAKIIPKWAAIQAHVYRVQRDAWSQLTNKKIIDSHITTTDIIQQYHEHMRAVQECLDNVTAIQKIRSEEPRSSVCSSNSSGSSRSNKLVSWQEILVTSGAKRKGQRPISVVSSSILSESGRSANVVGRRSESMIITGWSSSSSSRSSSYFSSSAEEDPCSSSMSLGDLLFGESQPAFRCVAVKDYESEHPERLSLHQGDVVHIWLPSKPPENSYPEWWYGRLETGQHFGWVPSYCCRQQS